MNGVPTLLGNRLFGVVSAGSTVGPRLGCAGVLQAPTPPAAGVGSRCPGERVAGAPPSRQAPRCRNAMLLVRCRVVGADLCAYNNNRTAAALPL